MSRRERTVRVYEVVYDLAPESNYAGPAGDGTEVARFRLASDAQAFAQTNTAWGRPAKAVAIDAPAPLARRWGFGS